MSNKALLFSILQYLNSLKETGTYDEESLESLDLATECLSGLESLDITDEQVSFLCKFHPPQLSTLIIARSSLTLLFYC